MVDRPCMACVVGLFEECHYPQEVEGQPDFIIPCAVWLGVMPGTRVEKEKGPIGRPLIDPSESKDPISAGRKRAASLHPILEGMVCEWAGLKHAGGGAYPLVGCAGNLLHAYKVRNDGDDWWQGDLHHGPDKNTFHNTPGVNLHAICNQCHKRWHELNDPAYSGKRPSGDQMWTPDGEYYGHDPVTGSTEDDREINEQWWDLPVKERGEYPFSPPETTRKHLTTPSDLGMLAHNPFSEKDFDLL